jgi:medium-chain acyl-[acyl-carrier-protein] hydrolase
MGSAADWLVRVSPVRERSQALVCIPHGGAGAGVFHQWKYALTGTASVWAACLPGRESRILEQPLTTINAMADSLTEPLRSLPVSEVAIFGHCSGALIAYELAHRISSGSVPLRCTCLIVSAHPFPVNPPGQDSAIADLPLPQLISQLRRIGGMTEAALRNAALMRLLEPAIRADFRAAENYRVPPGRPPLNIPVAAIGGTKDSRVSAAQLAGWKETTTADFRLQLIDGGHFYLHDQPQQVHNFIRKLLAESARAAEANRRQ